MIDTLTSLIQIIERTKLYQDVKWMSENMQTNRLACKKSTSYYSKRGNKTNIVTSMIHRIFRYYKYRKTLKELQFHSDHMLKDIGIKREWLDAKLGNRKPSDLPGTKW